MVREKTHNHRFSINIAFHSVGKQNRKKRDKFSNKNKSDPEKKEV